MDGSDERTTKETTPTDRRRLNGVRHRLVEPEKSRLMNRLSKALSIKNTNRNNGKVDGDLVKRRVHLRSQGTLEKIPRDRTTPATKNGLARSTSNRSAVKRTGHISSSDPKYRGSTAEATNHLPAGSFRRFGRRVLLNNTSTVSLPESSLNGDNSASGSSRRPPFHLVNGDSQSPGKDDLPGAMRRPAVSCSSSRRSSSLAGRKRKEDAEKGKEKRSYCRSRSRSAHSSGWLGRHKSSVGAGLAASTTAQTASVAAGRLIRSASSVSAVGRGNTTASSSSKTTCRRATCRSAVASSSLRASGQSSSTVGLSGTTMTGAADHEAFIRAFATPTHLYRYLAFRHRHCPLFLYRNLAYFRGRPEAAARTATSGTAATTADCCRASIIPVIDRMLQRPRAPTSNRLASSPENPAVCRQRVSNEPTTAESVVVPPGDSSPTQPLSAVPLLVKSPTPIVYWPSEVHLLFEGFFDSEKELDWVTVSASVSLYLRFGWSWRHKACAADSQMAPVPGHHRPIALACHNPALGSILPGCEADELSSAPAASTPAECRIQPMEVLRQTKWSARHGGRLTSGQLELRISASERRRLKRIDSATRVPNGGGPAGTVLLSSLSAADGRRNGLGSTAYPVSYRTSPLPLFQPPALVSGSWMESHPLILTPGRYELRLGVDTDDSDDEQQSQSLAPTRANHKCDQEVNDSHYSVKCRGSATTPAIATTTTVVASSPGVFEKFGLIRKQAADEKPQPSPVVCNGGNSVSSSALLATTESALPNGGTPAGETEPAPALTAHQGRGGWRRIRFPQTSSSGSSRSLSSPSVALDEYARWPRIRFRVVWHGREPVDASPGVAVVVSRRTNDVRLNGVVVSEPASSSASALNLLLQSRRKQSPRRSSSGNNGPRQQPVSPGKTNGDAQVASPVKSGSLSTTTVAASRRQARHSLMASAEATPPTTTPVSSTIESSSLGTSCPILRKTLQVLLLPSPTRRAQVTSMSKAAVVGPTSPLQQHPQRKGQRQQPITYRFVYLDRVQQWSEANNLICPWCQLDCARRLRHHRGAEALLSHLRTCHPRFCFKPIWSSGGHGMAAIGSSSSACPTSARSQSLCIEVSLNDSYDGSNDCGLRRWDGSHAESAGRRRLLVPPGQPLGGWTGLLSSAVVAGSFSQPGLRLSRPIRRLPYTHLIFWRGAERALDQSVDPTLSVRPIAQGHNRVYYHTRTVQPLRACEFDFDSEAEDAPNWLCQHYQRKVEEFTDVNQGEKQLMQLWNHLLLSVRPGQQVVCDSQLPSLASLFIQRHVAWIHGRRLRCNLLLHLANLVDYGLMSASHLRQLVALYDRLVAETVPTPSSVMVPPGADG